MKKLADLRQGVEFNGLYTGSMGHADLRSITSAKDALHAQAETIVNFVNDNLKLNTSKCEFLLSHISNSQPDVSDIHFSLSASTATKCLETWWTPNLSPKSPLKRILQMLVELTLVSGRLVHSKAS